MAHAEQLAFCRSVAERFPEYFARVRVLDVGSLNVNGSNAQLFVDSRYLGVDLAPGPNVDITQPAHLVSLPDATFEVIISTECFEHDRHLDDTLRNIYRMLKPGGLFLFTCATTGRPEHGTTATTPADAPLLPGEWAGYYRNVTEPMVRAALDVDALFSEYEFAVNEATHDLYFFGFKNGPRPISRKDFESQPGMEELEHRLRASEEARRALEQEIELQRHVEASLRAGLEAEDDLLANLRGSLSWRLTKPIRAVRRAREGQWRQLADEVIGELRARSRRGALALPGQAASRAVALFRPSRPRAERRFTILTPPHTEFVAHCLAHVLGEEGFEVDLASSHRGAVDPGQRFLVLCPQVFSSLPPSYYAFQMEQTVSPRWFTAAYLARLRAADAVLDYSVENAAVLLRLGVPFEKLFVVPVLPIGDYRRILTEEQGYGPARPEAPAGSGVVFYGDPSAPRRRHILEAMQRHLEVKVVSEVFGERLTAALATARVILNVHFYQGALLESTRLSQALSLGLPVVSEEGRTPEEQEPFHGLVDFVPAGDVAGLVAAARRLAEDAEAAATRRATIAARLQGARGLGDMFRRFLFAEGLIDWTSMVERTSLEGPRGPADGGLKSYCLTLPETPARRRGFRENAPPGFRLLEGLRHRTPWIGCGLSYKYLLGKLAADDDLVLVCEDDVEFPDDFHRRWPKVLDVLQRRRGQWDIFSGLIADLEEDTRVLDVDHHDGETFATLDRMTSTVFNVYDRAAMLRIGAWEPQGSDFSYAFDRWLQSLRVLRVLTVSPFLVGHSERYHSTLWPFDNRHYRDMIGGSQARLQAKVLAFRAGAGAG